jgi:dTDP-4-amino-4,6-dideoxygalactose transaminase
VVTSNPDYAQRLQLIRNHAEACVDAAGVTNLVNMVGFNFRLCEIESAIVMERLPYLPGIVHARRMNANYLARKLRDVPGITTPTTAPECKHAWYLYAMRYDPEIMGIARADFCRAVTAEGFPLVPGYVKPIYLEPMFQQRIALGSGGYPFNLSNITYNRGDCPVTEWMHFEELIYTPVINEDANQVVLDSFLSAIAKVIEYKGEI